MKVRRDLYSFYLADIDNTKENSKPNSKQVFDKLFGKLVVDPFSFTAPEIRNCKSLIQETCQITEKYYTRAYKKLEELGLYTNERDLNFQKVLSLVHYYLGTDRTAQLIEEIQIYDTKIPSDIWFRKLLITLARYEVFAIIAEKTSTRKTREDKNYKLRETIKNLLEKAKTNDKKLTQLAIGKKLGISKQRVGQLIKEIYQNK